MLKSAIIILICTALTGCCGFKLRGAYTIPPYLRTIYICPDDPYDMFQRKFRSLLKKHKVTILCEPSKNTTRLEISRPTMYEESLAVGPDGQVTRFKYSLSLTYTLTTPDVSYTRTIKRSRELSRSNNQLLSNESQKQRIDQELIQEAANELLRQITSQTPYNVSPLHSTTVDSNPC